MAYLREIHVPTCRRCGKKATHQLFNARNAPHADFCRRHGRAEKERLDRLEIAEYERQ
jgi:ribosomal protein L40E